MADKDFFGKIASFEDALRKFEEALEQSESGKNPTLADILQSRQQQARAEVRGAPQAQQPQWQEPADRDLYMSGNQSVVVDRTSGYEGSIEDDRVYMEPVSPQDIRPQDSYTSTANTDVVGQEGPSPVDSFSPVQTSITTYESDPSGLSALSNLNIGESASMLWWDDAGGEMVIPRTLQDLQQRNPLVQGVIWSEVLGRPVSRRRGRGRRNF